MSDRARAVLYGHTFRATDNRRYVGLLAEPIEQRIEAAIAAAHATGREEGMREAAKIVDACLPPGEVDSWNDGWLCGTEAASAAIFSAIGTQEDGQ